MSGQQTLPGTDEIIASFECGHGHTHQIPSESVTVFAEGIGYSATCTCGDGPIQPGEPLVLGPHIVLLGGTNLVPGLWLALDEEADNWFPNSNPDDEPLGSDKTAREKRRIYRKKMQIEHNQFTLENHVEDIRDGRSDDTLLGNCTHNASELAAALRARGIRAYVEGGALDVDDEPVGDTLAETRDHGLCHWWVLVRGGGECYVADLATEIPDKRGEVLATHGHPDEYVPQEINPDVEPSPGMAQVGSRT